jgi:hypothetical protein
MEIQALIQTRKRKRAILLGFTVCAVALWVIFGAGKNPAMKRGFERLSAARVGDGTPVALVS